MQGRSWWMIVTMLLGAMCLSLVVACSDDSDDDSSSDSTPAATMSHDETDGGHTDEGLVHVFVEQFQITGEDAAPISIPPAGEVTFEVHNQGTITHEFVVIKTDLAEGELPLDGDVVDENGTGVDIVDQIDAIDPDGSQVLTVTLDAGNYVLICNIATHYSQGMHASMQVT